MANGPAGARSGAGDVAGARAAAGGAGGPGGRSRRAVPPPRPRDRRTTLGRTNARPGTDEALTNAETEVVGDPEELRFDSEGYLEGF